MQIDVFRIITDGKVCSMERFLYYRLVLPRPFYVHSIISRERRGIPTLRLWRLSSSEKWYIHHGQRASEHRFCFLCPPSDTALLLAHIGGFCVLVLVNLGASIQRWTICQKAVFSYHWIHTLLTRVTPSWMLIICFPRSIFQSLHLTLHTPKLIHITVQNRITRGKHWRMGVEWGDTGTRSSSILSLLVLGGCVFSLLFSPLHLLALCQRFHRFSCIHTDP